MTQANLHLQLCVNDLLHPTESSESLLEALTSTQLEEIEKTLNKIKEKKQSTPSQLVSPIPITLTANPSTLHHDWALVAAQIAKALADTITTVTTPSTPKSVAKPPPKPTPSPSSSTIATETATTTATTTPATTTTSTPNPSSIPPTFSTNITPTATTVATNPTTTTANGAVLPNHEPRTEVRDGVEWVSFVYSHHRILRRYSIRTDVDQVDIHLLDIRFKSDNCVYPRANLPRDQYKGNRWAYETECNTLGWKLAYLNSTEIAGKRGLIQRAVDSYRNRYPSMRSRRVARQEKLLKGTLRKRKNRESEDGSLLMEEDETSRLLKQIKKEDTKQVLGDLPKTVSIDDGMGGAKYRIRINVDAVSLDSIDINFRRSNCVYPRAMDINTLSPFASQRQIEEAKCNELGWKLAWLNPKQLANKKSLLQRVLDVYRCKFLPELNPRKNSLRVSTTTVVEDGGSGDTRLTVAALTELEGHKTIKQECIHPAVVAVKEEDNESLHSGTTDSIDFHDCFSPPDADNNSGYATAPSNLMLSVPTSSDELLFGPSSQQAPQHPLFETTHTSCRRSISSSSSGGSDVKSPVSHQEAVFKDESLFELYTDTIQLPSAGVDFEHCDYIKTEDDGLMDPLISQLFRL
ncbi:uncharacterized protein EV154DRAFT_525150 [Mucor mucedo]|uniref:uncharacterized protein n=1 Tax=Mucor mucedo TaxID=29922 RepID=UPI00221E5DCB|nr:uncharacterized protein EV154DRAFT_525150 [Mucor mucedo]KAI7878112.1 hypothetical protein EV154DRAFT_525150 [Mucor mucedo]